MAKSQWKPWHEVVELRDDVRSGELSLATFAADLYAVVTGNAKPVYQDPEQFFSLTYPTYNLRELAKDVIARLLGKSEKAVKCKWCSGKGVKFDKQCDHCFGTGKEWGSRLLRPYGRMPAILRGCLFCRLRSNPRRCLRHYAQDCKFYRA